jgi:hypothetical protein
MKKARKEFRIVSAKAAQDAEDQTIAYEVAMKAKAKADAKSTKIMLRLIESRKPTEPAQQKPLKIVLRTKDKALKIAKKRESTGETAKMLQRFEATASARNMGRRRIGAPTLAESESRLTGLLTMK